MKMWAAADPMQAKRYTAVHVAGILGIGAVTVTLSLLQGILYIWLGMTEMMSLFFCLLTVALVLWLALLVRRYSRRNSLFFCLDEQDRLFAVDVLQMMRPRKGLVGYGEMALEVQRGIELLREQVLVQKTVPARAELILSVERLKEKEKDCVLVCRVQNVDGREYRRRWMIVRGYEEEEILLWQLRRRMRPEAAGLWKY